MITADQIEAIKALPKRQRGPHIDNAIVSLMQNGRTKTDAIRELAEALGISPSTVSVGYYRRRRDPATTPKPRKPAAASNGKGDAVVSGEMSALARRNARAAKSGNRWEMFEALINEIVEERVQARLAEIRKVLG